MARYVGKDGQLKKILNRRVRVGKKEVYVRGLAVIAVALASGTLTVAKTLANVLNKEPSRYIIAKTTDYEGDDFDKVIPVELEGSNNTTIPADSIVLVEEEAIVKKSNTIFFLNSNGEMMEGDVEGKYLSEILSVERNGLMKYNNAYEVISEEDVNFRLVPNFYNDKTVISSIAQGTIVLGGTPTAVKENEFLWTPVFVINSYGGNFGFIRSDLLALRERNVFKDKNYEGFTIDVNSANFAELPVIEEKSEDKLMTWIVDTAIDGGVELNLRKEPSGEGEVITKIPNGKEIHIYESDFYSSVYEGNREWIKVHYYEYTGEKKKEIVGYVSGSMIVEKEEPKVGKANDYVDTQSEQGKAEEDNSNKVSLMVSSKSGETAFRVAPNSKSDVLFNLRNEYVFSVSEDNAKEVGKKSKNKFIEANINGNVGYVDANDVIVIEKEYTNIDKNMETPLKELLKLRDKGKVSIKYKTNENGYVTLIDADGQNYTVEDLKTLANEGFKQDTAMCQRAKDEYNVEVDVSDMKHPSAFIIKVGASSKSQEFSISDIGYTQELIDACEKYNIPYLTYFYSTAGNKEEAAMEYEYIMKVLGKDCGMVVLDYEYDGRTSGEVYLPEGVKETSEQRELRVRNNTNALAYLRNAIELNGIKTVTYTSGRSSINEEERVFSLEDYIKQTGPVDLWLAKPRDGIPTSYGEEPYGTKTIEYDDTITRMKDCNIIIRQEGMDAYINVNGHNRRLDLNLMSEDDFIYLFTEMEKAKGIEEKNIEFVKIKNVLENKIENDAREIGE